jgi:hypothetical protein
VLAPVAQRYGAHRCLGRAGTIETEAHVLDAIGDLLPAAVGIALSPFPIIAVVLVLGSPRATANGTAFTVGWLLGLSAITALMILLTDGANDPASDTSALVAWARVAIGLALLGLAGKKWITRPRLGDEVLTPGWMASLEQIHPTRALGLAFVLASANPKNLAFTFSAASSISTVGLIGGDAAVAGGAFVALASASVIAIVVAHVVAGARSATALANIKEFMLANNAVIMMAILVLLGAKVLGDGLAGI